jgi:ribosomal protein S18 acetylase RimI-like enzyme
MGARRRAFRGLRVRVEGRRGVRARVAVPARERADVRLASGDDAEAIGRLLHDFNTEFDDITPGPRALADRVRGLLAGGDTAVVLGGAGPHGLAVLRFRPAIWADAPECYLAELYVIPDRRGHNLGRALMEAAIEVARARGAAWMDLATSEDDVAARALYESLGFSNREGRPDGPINYFYGRELEPVGG